MAPSKAEPLCSAKDDHANAAGNGNPVTTVAFFPLLSTDEYI